MKKFFPFFLFLLHLFSLYAMQIPHYQLKLSQNTVSNQHATQLASEIDIKKVYSGENFDFLCNALNQLKNGNVKTGVEMLRVLAIWGDVPSRTILFEYFNNSFEKYQSTLEEDISISQQWLEDAALNHRYPPALFLYGKQLNEEQNMPVGIPFIREAAHGGFLLYNHIHPLRYYNFNAARYLADCYTQLPDHKEHAAQWELFVNYLENFQDTTH